MMMQDNNFTQYILIKPVRLSCKFYKYLINQKGSFINLYLPYCQILGVAFGI